MFPQFDIYNETFDRKELDAETLHATMHKSLCICVKITCLYSPNTMMSTKKQLTEVNG